VNKCGEYRRNIMLRFNEIPFSVRSAKVLAHGWCRP